MLRCWPAWAVPRLTPQVLRALSSANDEEVQIAQVYLHHRPIADATELRGVATAIARMNGSDAQVRALDTLARYRLSDRETLGADAQLFPLTKSVMCSGLSPAS